jgi:hypothetical protein
MGICVIQDTINSLTTSSEGLQIKKIRIIEFMGDACNLSIKVATCHSKGKTCPKTLEARAKWIEEWQGLHFMQNYVLFDEAGFDINMCHSRDWSRRGTPAVIESPSAKGVSHTIIREISAFGVVNVNIREPDNAKTRESLRLNHGRYL